MNSMTTNVNIPLEVFTFKRQDELAVFAANTIIKNLFPSNQDTSFSVKNENQDIEKLLNETLVIKSQNKEILAKVTLRVSLVRLGANFPGIVDEPYNIIIDKFKEFINQFLGVINQNIIDAVGMEFRIGLPTHFGNSLGNEEHLMIPGTHLIDSTGTFDLNIGFVRIRGTQDIDLKDVEFVLVESSEDEIDFF